MTQPGPTATGFGYGRPNWRSSPTRPAWQSPIEALLPIGVRHRQLRVRTLLAGMMLSQADQRPAHLTRIRDALIALPADGPHQLTYRQIERTFGLAADALAKDIPDGLPPDTLASICDQLLEATQVLPRKAPRAGSERRLVAVAASGLRSATT